MTQDTSTYYVWIGGSCDYGHKERAGGAAVVIEHSSLLGIGLCKRSFLLCSFPYNGLHKF